MSGLEIASWVFLGLGILTALVIAFAVSARPQPMRIMNIVWPITGLYFPVVGFLFYRAFGAPMAAHKMEHHEGRGREMRPGTDDQDGHSHSPPSAKRVFLSASHCGSGCVIGDVIGAPIVLATGFTIFGKTLFADYVVEFLLAYIFGVAFQFFPIRSMRELSPGKALVEAIKADTLSLVAFEVGMFAWMAIVDYLLMPSQPPKPDSPVFWFMMQIGLVLGFATTYPANWLLIRWGIKSGMC